MRDQTPTLSQVYENLGFDVTVFRVTVMLRSRVAHSVVSISRHRRGTNAQGKRTISEAAERSDAVVEDRSLAKTVFYGDESAIIRAPSFPGSMRDVLAIVRAVERNYGLIKEFKCYRVCLIPIILSVLSPIALGLRSFVQVSVNY